MRVAYLVIIISLLIPCSDAACGDHLHTSASEPEALALQFKVFSVFKVPWQWDPIIEEHIALYNGEPTDDNGQQ